MLGCQRLGCVKADLLLLQLDRETDGQTDTDAVPLHIPCCAFTTWQCQQTKKNCGRAPLVVESVQRYWYALSSPACVSCSPTEQWEMTVFIQTEYWSYELQRTPSTDFHPPLYTRELKPINWMVSREHCLIWCRCNKYRVAQKSCTFFQHALSLERFTIKWNAFHRNVSRVSVKTEANLQRIFNSYTKIAT